MEKEFFKFKTFDKKSIEKFVGKDKSPEIQELNKNQAMTRMQTIKKQEMGNNQMRFMPVNYQHRAMKM